MTSGVHSIYSQGMEPRAFTHYIWSPLHLHMRDLIVAVLRFSVVQGEAGKDTCRFLLTVLLRH